MDSTTRRVGGLSWTPAGDAWETWHAAAQWRLARHRRRDGHVDHDGWYLHGHDDDEIFTWAGSRIEGALKVASLLVIGEWDRTGLRELDGTVTWRNVATSEIQREPDLLATLEGDRHKTPLISLRLPQGDRSWLLGHAKETGRPVNAVLAEALAAYRRRVERSPRR